jgi:hypothetical protein
VVPFKLTATNPGGGGFCRPLACSRVVLPRVGSPCRCAAPKDRNSGAVRTIQRLVAIFLLGTQRMDLVTALALLTPDKGTSSASLVYNVSRLLAFF